MLQRLLRNIAGADDNAGRVQAVYARYAMKDRYMTKPLTGNPHQDMDPPGSEPEGGLEEADLGRDVSRAAMERERTRRRVEKAE
jgi:hypothetical protein